MGTFSRTATEDVEVGGVVIAAGEKVVVSIPAARTATRSGSRTPTPSTSTATPPATSPSGTAGPDLDVAAEEIRFHGGEHLLLGVASLPVRW